MSGEKAFVPLAIIAAVGVLGTTSAAWSNSDREGHVRSTVVTPCRLYGINPLWHSEIFGNPAYA
jgi:hypothetical protein